MTPEFDKLYEGLWDNINKAKKRGKVAQNDGVLDQIIS